MTELSNVNFEHVDINEFDDWREEQWKRSRVVFDSFYDYLLEKGIKESTAARKTNMAATFIMNFLFVYMDHTENMLEADDDDIRSFLGNWYIRKSMRPTTKEINQFLISIADFYTFLHKKGYFSKGSLAEIKEVCKDKEWFAERLDSYHSSDGDDFYDWISEYNYDCI